jgi:hypothetical protein
MPRSELPELLANLQAILPGHAPEKLICVEKVQLLGVERGATASDMLPTALFLASAEKEVWQKHRVLKGLDGGRGWDRTSDPYDVNVVLSR